MLYGKTLTIMWGWCRGAAARALSKFGWFAIKISTDGYLELYVQGRDPVYKIWIL